jgi:hypothetical protein
MAKKEKNVQTRELTIADPVTGIDIRFDAGQQAHFNSIKSQMKDSLAAVGLSLRTIRDQKYYLMDDCGSMSEWLLNTWGSSIRTAQRLLEVADAFDSIPNANEIMSLPLTHLLTMKKDPATMEALRSGDLQIDDGHAILPTGETMDLPSFVRKIKKETETEIRSKESRLKEQLNNSKEATHTMEEALEKSEAEKAEIIGKLKTLEKTINDLMQKKDLDGMRVAFVTQRDEAAVLLDDSMTIILDHLGQIDNIPHDLVDGKLAGHFGRTLAGIESAMERIRDRWSPIIYTPTGGDREQMVP